VKNVHDDVSRPEWASDWVGIEVDVFLMRLLAKKNLTSGGGLFTIHCYRRDFQS